MITITIPTTLPHDLPLPTYYPAPDLAKVPGDRFGYYWIQPGPAFPELWSWAWTNQHQTKCRWKQIGNRKTHIRKDYPGVRICGPGNPRCGLSTWIHRLSMLTYGGPPPFPDAQVRHLDRIESNPAYLDNHLRPRLIWGSNYDNWTDSIAHGTARFGEAQTGSKLTTADVLGILQLAKQGHTLRSIARMYGVCDTTVRHIIIGRGWRHITNPGAL